MQGKGRSERMEDTREEEKQEKRGKQEEGRRLSSMLSVSIEFRQHRIFMCLFGLFGYGCSEALFFPRSLFFWFGSALQFFKMSCELSLNLQNPAK